MRPNTSIASEGVTQEAADIESGHQNAHSKKTIDVERQFGIPLYLTSTCVTIIEFLSRLESALKFPRKKTINGE